MTVIPQPDFTIQMAGDKAAVLLMIDGFRKEEQRIRGEIDRLTRQIDGKAAEQPVQIESPPIAN